MAARAVMTMTGSVIKRQRQPADQRRGSRHVEDIEEDREAEQPEDDRRHRRQVVDRHFDKIGPAAVGRQIPQATPPPARRSERPRPMVTSKRQQRAQRRTPDAGEFGIGRIRRRHENLVEIGAQEAARLQITIIGNILVADAARHFGRIGSNLPLASRSMLLCTGTQSGPRLAEHIADRASTALRKIEPGAFRHDIGGAAQAAPPRCAASVALKSPRRIASTPPGPRAAAGSMPSAAGSNATVTRTSLC